MANAKELQNRIKSIKDTMKITKAMYMMSSMKLRKAKQKLENTEPFFYELQEQISNILCHFPDMQHLYFDNRAQDKKERVKKKGFIVITGDKGMAGAYNHNVIKMTKGIVPADGDYKLFVVGEIGRHHFKNQKYAVAEDFMFSANNPSIHRARVITENIVDLYKREQLDEIYIVYTRMVNSMSTEVEVEQLLPLRTHEFIKEELVKKAEKDSRYSEDLEHADDWFLIYPSARQVIERLVYDYITGFVYGALVQGSASEENSRMLAMQSATNSADEMLRELSVQYNRIRQAAITQEITEVIGGAKALKNKKKKQAR